MSLGSVGSRRHSKIVDVKKMPPTPIFMDNAGVLSMLKGNTVKPANRHIFRTLAENRETVHLDKVVVPIKVPTKENLANAMTKQETGLRESAAQLCCITGPIKVVTSPRRPSALGQGVVLV